MHLRLPVLIAAALVCLSFPLPARAKLVVGKLVLHGITKTRDDALYARMRLRPGDPVDDAVLKGPRSG